MVVRCRTWRIDVAAQHEVDCFEIFTTYCLSIGMSPDEIVPQRQSSNRQHGLILKPDITDSVVNPTSKS